MRSLGYDLKINLVLEGDSVFFFIVQDVKHLDDVKSLIEKFFTNVNFNSKLLPVDSVLAYDDDCNIYAIQSWAISNNDDFDYYNPIISISVKHSSGLESENLLDYFENLDLNLLQTESKLSTRFEVLDVVWGCVPLSFDITLDFIDDFLDNADLGYKFTLIDRSKFYENVYRDFIEKSL